MKGMIADIKGKKAVMLAENGEFITIPNKDYFVGQTVNCRLHSYKHPAAYAVAAAVAAVMCIGGHSAYYMPVSTIDIDINPSIRIEINVFDRVIDIVPLNDDADKLLSVCDKKGGAIDECLDEIIEQSYAMGYLNETNNSIEMDVVSTHKKTHEAAEKYNGGMNLNGMNITAAVEKADREELKKAKELNISVGRLRAIDEYSVEYGGNEESNAEKLKDIPTKEIKKRTETVSSANINSEKSALAEKNVDKTSKSENDRGNTDKNNNVKTAEKVQYTDVIKASPRSIDNVNKSASTANKSSAVSVSRPEFKTLPSNTSQSTAANSEIKNSKDSAKSYDISKSVNEDKPNISKPEFDEINTKPNSEQTSDNTEEKSENEAVTMPAEKEKPVIEVPDFTNKDNWFDNDKKNDKTDKPNEDKKEDKSEENSSSDDVNKNDKVPENKDKENPANGDNDTLKPNEDNKNNGGSADKADSSGNNEEKPNNLDNKTDSGKNEFEKPNNSDNKNNTADKTDNGRNDDGKSDNLKPNDKNNEEKPDNSNKTEIIDKPQNPNGENDKPKNDGTNTEPAQRPQNPNNGGNKADSTQDNKGSGRDNQSQSPSGGNADRPQNPNPGQSKGQPNGSGSGGASLSGDSGGHTGNERSSSGNSLSGNRPDAGGSSIGERPNSGNSSGGERSGNEGKQGGERPNSGRNNDNSGHSGGAENGGPNAARADAPK